VKEGRRSGLLRLAHDDVERPDCGGVRGVPHPAPDGRRSAPGLALREPVEGQYFAYQNVVGGFQHPMVALAYVVAIVLLTMHLYHHGLWSMFQSVGISHPRYTPALKRTAHAVSILVAASYISISRLRDVGFGEMMELNSKVPSGPIQQAWERRKFELKLINPANKRKYTVIVVGSGLAGASAAAGRWASWGTTYSASASRIRPAARTRSRRRAASTRPR